MDSIYRLLAHEMLLMSRDGKVISIPRESRLVLALPALAKDHFFRKPIAFKAMSGTEIEGVPIAREESGAEWTGSERTNLVGIPLRYESAVFAMLILNELFITSREVLGRLQSAQNMIEWYIHIIHQRRMICELHARTETLSYADLVEEHARALKSSINYRKISDTLKHAYLDTIYRLSITAEYKDKDTTDHVKRMSIYSKMLAEKMGLKSEEVGMMLCASPMHDIGKMGVPDAVLLKPGRLDPGERGVMEQHPIFGANILGGSDSELLEYAKAIALTHHERWDGTGYPQKLKGKDIPLAGRIVAVADVFDAMTTNRPYRPAWSFDDAMGKISRNKGGHFDPEISDCFLGSRKEVRIIFDNYKNIAPWSFGE